MNKLEKENKIMDFYKTHKGCHGAVKVDNHIEDYDSIIRHSTPTHNFLIKLVEKGKLEKCQKWKGFKLAS